MIELDKGFEKPIYIVCDFCIHLIEAKKTCKAFQNGIPDEIIMGKNDHSKPLINQTNKIVFEKRPVSK